MGDCIRGESDISSGMISAGIAADGDEQICTICRLSVSAEMKKRYRLYS